jgi:DNA-binding transcriptional MerR regulator
MRIGELAESAGVSSQTIRFYEGKGLLPEAERGANGYRLYDESAATRLRFVALAQAAGLTLSQIRSILDLRDQGTTPCQHVTTLLDTRLTDVRTRIRDLSTLQAELEVLLQRSQRLDPGDCADQDICHILSPSQ